jgi:lipopolysaccharide transport system permease protein
MQTKHFLIIEPGLAEHQYWRDLWRYRELFFVLAWRDVSIRYKQTLLGLAWALIQPVATMVVFSFVFGRVANLPTEGGAPYPLLVFAGLLPWQLFASSLAGASSSLIGNTNLISKVYFPRLIIPSSAVVVSLIDFFISLLILFLLMVWYKFMPSWEIFTLPIFVLMAFLASLGPGLWITSLNVKYRDFRYVIPFIIQFGLYVSPVGFSSAVISEDWRLIYSINPMVGVIDGFRWAILRGQSNIYIPGFILSWGLIFFFLWLGIDRFRKMEKSFADLI